MIASVLLNAKHLFPLQTFRDYSLIATLCQVPVITRGGYNNLAFSESPLGLKANPSLQATASLETRAIKICVALFLAFALSAVLCRPIFCAEYYTKSDVSGKRFAVFEPTLRGVESGDATWLPTAVAEPLRTNFKLYIGVVLIDVSNTESIRQIQRKQESGAFDQKTALEAGRLLNAQFAVFPIITKTKNTYQFSCAVTDLQTGERVASATVSEVVRVNDLYGQALGKTVLNLAPQMGVELTSLGKFALSGTSENSSFTEQRALAQQDVNTLATTLNELNARLKKIGNSSSLFDEAERAQAMKIEAEKNLMEQKLAAAQKRMDDLQSRQQKEMREKQRAVERSLEAQKKLENLSAEVDKKAAELRSKQNANMTLEEKVILLEKKKSIYMELKLKVGGQKQAVFNEAKKLYDEQKKDENEKSLYRKAELGLDGKPTENARLRVRAENAALLERLEREAQEESFGIDLASQKQLASLLAEIQKSQTTIAKRGTDSSVTTAGIFSVGNYDSEKYTWSAFISLQLGGNEIVREEIKIHLDDISKAIDKKVFSKNYAAKDYEEFLDAVEVYDSMFAMSSQFVYLEVDYKMEAMPQEYPSLYKYTPLEYRIMNSLNSSCIKKIAPKSTSSFIQYSPATDMRGAK